MTSRPLVQFSLVVFSHPLLHVPLSTCLVFILGELAGQANRAYAFMLDFMFELVERRLSCVAFPVLQLLRFRLFLKYLESTLH